MRLFHFSCKKIWILAAGRLLAALVSFVFLPDRIAIHFYDGAPDSYASKVWIFIFPCLQIFLLLLSEIKSFKTWCIYCKGPIKTENQYFAVLLTVIILLAVLEAAVIIFSL